MIIWVDEASAIIDAAAAIAGDASNPSASLSAPSGKFAGGRRVSVMGNAKTPPSMVAQLKNELAVMMAHINTTVRRDEHNRWNDDDDDSDDDSDDDDDDGCDYYDYSDDSDQNNGDGRSSKCGWS